MPTHLTAWATWRRLGNLNDLLYANSTRPPSSLACKQAEDCLGHFAQAKEQRGAISTLIEYVMPHFFMATIIISHAGLGQTALGRDITVNPPRGPFAPPDIESPVFGIKI